MPQGIDKVMIQLKDTPTKVYAIDEKDDFIKGSRCASKFCIDPNNRHNSYFRKCTGSNKRNVPIKRAVSCNWNRRVRSYHIMTCLLFSACWW